MIDYGGNRSVTPAVTMAQPAQALCCRPGTKTGGGVDTDVADRALRKVGIRLVPFLGALYFAAFLDRVNVGFAAEQMHRDLGFSDFAYGLGAGIFFIGYCLFEVPSNLVLHRVGARRWIARIMVTWALLAGAMAFVKGLTAFYVLRFLLGVAEAGFFPGIVYYLSFWIPAARRARLVGAFMTAVPISTALGGPLSTGLLALDGTLGLAGWQWLFLVEAAPALVLGIATLGYLRDVPAEAPWLAADEREWLTRTMQAERSPTGYRATVVDALTNPRVLALGCCYFGAELSLYGVILWIPQILVRAGVAVGSVGYVVAIPYAIAAVGMVWWCRRSDRAQERIWHLAAAALAGFAGVAASAILSNSPVAAIIAVTVGATGTLAILPIFWTLPVASLRGAAAAGGIALINSIGNLGGFAGPFVIGWVKQATGSFTWGLLVVATGLLVTGAMALLLGHDSAAEHAGRAPETTR